MKLDKLGSSLIILTFLILLIQYINPNLDMDFQGASKVIFIGLILLLVSKVFVKKENIKEFK
jgi:hypothetical protein